jgi:hypothetical protein
MTRIQRITVISLQLLLATGTIGAIAQSTNKAADVAQAQVHEKTAACLGQAKRDSKANDASLKPAVNLCVKQWQLDLRSRPKRVLPELPPAR